MSKSLVAAAIALCMALLTACTGSVVSHDYHAIDRHGWRRTDTLRFPISLSDSATCYRLHIDVRHRGRYPRIDLPLTLLMSRDDGTPSPTDILPTDADTLRYTLANERGIWTGRGWGGLYQYRFYAATVCTEHPGHFTLSLIQATDDTLLTGLSDVGLRVERVK